jgi:hypothetical protein
MFCKMMKCTKQFFRSVFILRIAHGPVISLAVFHFPLLNTQLSSKYTWKMVFTVYNLYIFPVGSGIQTRSEACPPPSSTKVKNDGAILSLPHMSSCSSDYWIKYRDFIFSFNKWKMICYSVSFFIVFLFLSIMKAVGAFFICIGLQYGWNT